MLAGRQKEILDARDRKLEEAAGSGNCAGKRWHDTQGYNDCARRNGSGLCRDATMPRTTWRLIETMTGARRFRFRALQKTRSDR